MLKNAVQESQVKCQELGAAKTEAQAKLDQLNEEKTNVEQLLVEAKRSVEETKIAVRMLREIVEQCVYLPCEVIITILLLRPYFISALCVSCYANVRWSC